MGLKGIRRLNPALARSLPRLPGRGLSRIPAEYSVEIDRRDIEMDSEYLRTLKKGVPVWIVQSVYQLINRAESDIIMDHLSVC